MKITVAEIAMAAAWAVGMALAAWVLTWRLRRRSARGLLLALALISTAGSAGALLGAVRAMLLPPSEIVALLLLAGAGGVLTAVVAAASARRVNQDVLAVSAAIDDLGTGRAPDLSRPRLRTDLEELRSQLDTTAADLHESYERERALQSSHRELITWISHDLRAPLAGLRAMAEALEDGLPDQPEIYYKRIGSTVGRLSGMVDDLFELSQLRAGTAARDAELVSLSDLVSDATAAATPIAESNGVRLVGAPVPTLTVSGSAAELSRVLLNVITNAIRHTGSGGAVQVSVTSSASGGAACVSIEDECGGIDEDVIGRVFDIGFSGDSARTPDSGRAGLGLAITKGIVEAHSGSVSVENTVSGCRFDLTIPLVPSLSSPGRSRPRRA